MSKIEVDESIVDWLIQRSNELEYELMVIGKVLDILGVPRCDSEAKKK